MRLEIHIINEGAVKSLYHSYYMRIDLGEYIISQVGNLQVRQVPWELECICYRGCYDIAKSSVSVSMKHLLKSLLLRDLFDF